MNNLFGIAGGIGGIGMLGASIADSHQSTLTRTAEGLAGGAFTALGAYSAYNLISGPRAKAAPGAASGDQVTQNQAKPHPVIPERL